MSALRPLVILLALALAVLAALSLAPAPAAAHPGHGAGYGEGQHGPQRLAAASVATPVTVPKARFARTTAPGPIAVEGARGRTAGVEGDRTELGRSLRLVEPGHAGIACREGCCTGSCCTAGPCVTALAAAEGPAAGAPAASSGVRQPERAAPTSLAREAGLRPPRRGV